MKKLSDQEIINSILKGNTEDFKYIIDRYKDKAFSLLVRMIKNQQDAEEALQDSFLKAYKALPGFKWESKFSSWFYRIVYNTALTKIANNKTNIETIDIEFDDNDEPVNDLSSLYDDNDMQFSDITNFSEIINNLLAKLPVRYSAVISMFYLDEMSIEEIASSTGMTVTNVKVTLHRARNLLKSIAEKTNIKHEIY
ncbi:MAG TPA: RNA polymerase sigma factor [Ignavibacteriales bacterium]|nr:RNA polymerase sigma factor [Ignavibacteriales bacterium]HOL81248.1 RNA polymerase sigma factor [Ignavibacteriales bacterium]HOM66232.1 RNA polymerase sigma factor [Ignavibacteriales bacterium]HPD68345.1 RNA polymerase sigma factor [Ignavibacteriales bacterium]HPP33359.1 RNA polymerase sigma factor [Ignavibacteriales bacterium]